MASTNSAMADALATERAALKDTGGIMDGSIAANVAPSTPRSPADVRPERVRSTDPDAFGVPTGREEEWRFTPLERVRVLLDGAPSDARLQVDSEVPGRRRAARGPDRRARRAGARRPARRARARRAPAARWSSGCPRRSSSTSPSCCAWPAPAPSEVVWGHVVARRRRAGPRHRRARAHRQRALRRVRLRARRRRRGAAARPGAGLGRRRRPRRARRQPAGPRRPAAVHRR